MYVISAKKKGLHFETLFIQFHPVWVKISDLRGSLDQIMLTIGLIHAKNNKHPPPPTPPPHHHPQDWSRHPL